MLPPLFPITLSLYAAAGTLYLAHVISSNERLARAARIVLGVAVVSQGIDIGWLCAHGLHPVVNAREAVYFASWLTCGAYLIASLRLNIPLVGALVVPASLVLDVAARLSPSTEGKHAETLLGSVHITLASAGVACFAVAAGGAIVYLATERSLKKHKGGMLGRGPALQTLDYFNRRCITFGFPIFTVAMVTGAIWVLRIGHSVLTPQYLMSTVAWLLYAGLLVARITAGWRGRRAALMTLAGFATAMMVLLIYFLRGVVGA
jgi:ABC-type uncharacterized transport system permease subunit